MDKFRNFFRQYFQVIIILILVFFMVNLSARLSAMRLKEFPVNLDRPQGMQIFTEMIGEVRTILASYLYIRADMYHHEREEKVAWNKDTATLPLHRLVTALDPKFVKAYDFGAYQLAVNLKKPREGIKFLREGLHYNPESFELHFTMGNIYYNRKEFKTAIKWHKMALKLAKTRVDTLNCLRRLYWEYRKIGDYTDARKYITILRQEDPGYPIYPRFEKELDQLVSGEKTEADFEKERQKQKEKELKEEQEKYHNHKGHNHGGSGHAHEETDAHEQKADDHDHDSTTVDKHDHETENGDTHN